MLENSLWINKRKFVLFYVIINLIYLIELLPSLGRPLPITFSSRKILLVLLFIAIAVVVCRHRICKNSISTLFLIMSCYCFFITVMNKNIQQQPMYYYCTATMYPWIITYISERLFQSFKYIEEIDRVWKFISIFSLLYSFLLFQYKANTSIILTASGEASIYYILTLLPFILCCNGKFRNVLLTLLIIAVFVALKRTALIAITASIFAYLLVRFKNRDERKFRLVIYALVSVVLVIIIYQLVVKYTGNDVIAKILSTEEDGGSNRDYIYAEVIKDFKSISLSQKILGIGYNGVRYSYNIVSAGTVVSAHNDFLEVLCDYGIIGMLFYLGFVIKILRKFISLKRIGSPYAPAMAAALVIFFVLSMFSHLLIYTSYFMNLLIFFVMMEHIADQSREGERFDI